jgi:phosphopantothenoylcysteine decarboxylase/phosphopantothenate--cysteine ligase
MTRKTLAGREIVIGVTGSISAVETVKLIHALRRRGASVQPVMSAAAQSIIHPDALTYASGRDVITRLSGRVEHVAFCGDEGSADLLLIAPCTANTIGKIACGIDDTPVTTFATTALGSRIPIMIVPAMHHSMYRHPAVVKNIRLLRDWGIEFAGPKVEEGKAKIADIMEIVLRCERAVLGNSLANKHVLITSGSCREPVDDVRVLTTRSSGLMGQELALEAFRLGADVTVVHRDMLPCVTNVPVETAGEMREAVEQYFRKNPPDIYLSAAAISDFAPFRTGGKIPSGRPVHLELEPLPKLLDLVLENRETIVVAFKIGKKTRPAAQALLDRGVTMVVTNTPASMGTRTGDYRILTKKECVPVAGDKDEIAAAIWQHLARNAEAGDRRRRSRRAA